MLGRLSVLDQGSMGLQMKRLFASALVLACASPAIAQTDRIRFWNLTANTITKFYLAPAGTDKYGPDQCVNDRDGTVDHDERLRITGVTPGRYDAKFQDKKGRVCVVKNIDVKAGGIFSIEERQVSNCQK
jgi:hypothetical protein